MAPPRGLRLLFFGASGLFAVLATPRAGGAQPDAARPRYTAADVEFMQGMIFHHAQAIEMSALVPGRTKLVPLQMLAERITVSQRDEIRLIRHWLLDHREEAPPAESAEHHGHQMPGMLSAEQITELTEATGSKFERLFLEGMIRHHEGALTMVANLFATQGAGQDVDIFRFASDVEADQRAEISRMRLLLKRMTESQ
jgi:uncharacterized protein (DUF305 family)